MLLNRQIWLLSVFLVLLSSLALAETCEVSQIRNALRRGLFDYLQEPSEAVLSLPQVQDLLVFYLGIDPTQQEVDCGIRGVASDAQIVTLVGQAAGIARPLPTCRDGTEYGHCSLNPPWYCYKGQLINNCELCGCPKGICQKAGKSAQAVCTQRGRPGLEDPTIPPEPLPEPTPPQEPTCTDTDFTNATYEAPLVTSRYPYGGYQTTVPAPDAYVAGSVYGLDAEGRSYEIYDGCQEVGTNSDAGYYLNERMCVETSNQTLIKYYSLVPTNYMPGETGIIPMTKVQYCPFGCYNGACAAEPTCFETDAGNDPYEAGVTYGTLTSQGGYSEEGEDGYYNQGYEGQYGYGYDRCDEGVVLQELFCAPNPYGFGTRLTGTLFQCSCSGGRCLSGVPAVEVYAYGYPK